MSTSDKLTYLNETKTQIRKGLNRLGADLTSEDTFRSYADELDEIYDRYPKITGTGETLTLENTTEAQMQLDLLGNTSQDSDPTPSTPQQIHTCSGDNTIKVEGKNLCDNDIVLDLFLNPNLIIGEADGCKLKYAKVPKNTNITISRTIVTNRFRIGLLNEIPKKNVSFYMAYNNDASTSLSQTINTGDYEYVAIQYTNQSDNANIQVEIGSTATTYEAYTSQSQLISLGTIELCKIGTYQDKIYKDNGKWYLHKETGKVVLNGSENNYSYANNTTATDYGYVTSASIDNLNQTVNGLTNNFKNYGTYFLYNTNTNGEVFCITSGGTQRLRFMILKSRLSTLDVAGFKTWLSNNNVTVYYVLATPTNTEITDTTLLEALENIYSMTGTTNITQENNDLPMGITAKALMGE